MNIERSVGMVTGFLVGLVIAAILLRFTKKDKNTKCKYDERQQLIRGKAYQYAYYALVFYMLAYAFLQMVIYNIHADPFIIIFFGICISIFVYSSYCIWHDCFFALNERPKSVIISFSFIALINIFIGIGQLCNGELMADGIISFRFTNIVTGVLFGFIMLVILVRKLVNRLEREQEE